MDAAIRHAARDIVCIVAPEDCTEARCLRRLLDDVRAALGKGVSRLTVDLSAVRRMNARLLATVLLLAREVGRAGATMQLIGASDEFKRWARTFQVLGPLERHGLISV